MKCRLALVVLGAQLAVNLSLWAQNPACPSTSGQNLPSCREVAEGQSQAALTWNCWQETLYRTSIDESTYRSLRLKVTFTRSGYPATNFSNYAFWDGATGSADIVRIRAMFPSSGTWTWTLTCESGPCGPGSGLTTGDYSQGQRTITVSAYDAASHGANPLFEKGRLKQSIVTRFPTGAKTYLKPTYNNGQTFLWHGDSAWAAPPRARPSEWRSYINNRALDGTTVVQIGIAPEWAGGCNEAITGGGEQPAFLGQPSGALCERATDSVWVFDDEEGAQRLVGDAAFPTSDSKVNPAFFDRLDRFVQQANCRGVIPFIAGVSQPVSRYPSSEAAVAFAHNLAARLSGNHVILSPGFDDDIDAVCVGGTPSGEPGPVAELLSEVGSTIAATTKNLVINHFGTNAKLSEPSLETTTARLCQLKNESWNALNMVQSGKNGNASSSRLSRVTERPRRLPYAMRGLDGAFPGFTNPSRPVVNGEAVYDHGFEPTESDGQGNFSRYRARQAAYSSWFSGATGYTFGAAGIWDWGVCGTNFPPPGDRQPTWCTTQQPDPVGAFTSFDTAMAADSSADMALLEDYLRGINFSSLLVNEQTRIVNQPAAPEFAMSLAREPDRLLVYLPHNQLVDVDLSGLSFFTTGAWVSTRSDVPASQTAVGTARGGGVFRYATPNFTQSELGAHDWVLFLIRDASGGSLQQGPSPAGEGLRLEWDADAGTWTAYEPVTLGARKEALFAARSALPPLYRQAEFADGRKVVAWIESDPVRQVTSTWIRWQPKPEGDWSAPMSLTEEERASSVNLSLTASPDGRILVVGNTTSARGSLLTIRSIAPESGFVGDPLEVAAGEPGTLGSAAIGCSQRGTCLVAFESKDPEAGEVSVIGRMVDTRASAAGEATVLESGEVGSRWLEAVSVESDDRFTVRWEAIDEAGSRGRMMLGVRDTPRGLETLGAPTGGV